MQVLQQVRDHVTSLLRLLGLTHETNLKQLQEMVAVYSVYMAL